VAELEPWIISVDLLFWRKSRLPELDGAGRLIAYLAAPALAPVLIRKGLEPVTGEL
jgi:hypothetical protein